MKAVVDKRIAIFSVLGLIFFLFMAGLLSYYFIAYYPWSEDKDIDYYFIMIFGGAILFVIFMTIVFLFLVSTFGRILYISSDGIQDQFLGGRIHFTPIEAIKEIDVAMTVNGLKNYIYFSTFELSRKEKLFILDVALKKRKDLKIVRYSPERYHFIQNLYPEKIKKQV